METVIANRPALVIPAPGGNPASAGQEGAGDDDFAAHFPGEDRDDAVSDSPAVSGGMPVAGLTVAGLWSGAPFAAGQGGDGALDPTLPITGQPDAVAASGSGVILVPAAVDARGLPDHLLADGPGAQAKGADARALDGQMRAPQALGAAVFGTGQSQAANAVTLAGQVAPETAELSVQLPDPASVGGQMVGSDPSAVALAAVGVRLWQGATAAVEDLPSVQDGPPAPAADPGPEAPATALGAGGARSVTSQYPSPLGPAAGMAEAALLSLFAAQAEAALPDPEGGGVGHSLAAISAVLGGPMSAGGPASVLPQLSAPLVHILSRPGESTTEIALSPDELGHVRVTLQTDSQNPDRMIVMLNFERVETLDLFRRNADQLADALRDAGYSGVNIGFGQPNGNDNGSAAEKPPGPPEPNLSEPTLAWPNPSLDPSGDRPVLRLSPSGTLDLRI